jgi:hypothetical protein
LDLAYHLHYAFNDSNALSTFVNFAGKGERRKSAGKDQSRISSENELPY